jgi:transcription antitermination protein NusB
MSARTKARKRALDMLYSADVRGEGLQETLAVESARAEAKRASSWGYARDIVTGVLEHGPAIDELIESYSTAWPLSRMPAVDRAILRMAGWELLHNPEVPDSVAISQAVGLAQELSTEDSAGFINGILGAMAKGRE